MYESGTGVATIETDDAMQISVGDFGAMTISSATMGLYHKNMRLGWMTPTGKISMTAGELYMNNKKGLTGTFLV